MEGKMEFLCDMWKFSAEEYMAFLERNGVKCFGVHVIYRNSIMIYVDEEQYLELSLNNQKFMQDEKQIIKLLEQNETLVNKFIELASKIESNLDASDESYDMYEEQE